MEPWQEEALLQLSQDRRRQTCFRCQCCGEPITTEYYLELTPFGINARACEICTEANTHETQL